MPGELYEVEPAWRMFGGEFPDDTYELERQVSGGEFRDGTYEPERASTSKGCCICNYPCGGRCIDVDPDTCAMLGGHVIGDYCDQLLACDTDVCHECTGDPCQSSFDCPTGYSCISGHCVRDVLWGGGCNTTGFPNCKRVIHVHRPVDSFTGTPFYELWGITVKTCECGPEWEYCDYSTEGVTCMDLAVDKYEDSEPAGVYFQQCCCPLYLHTWRCSEWCSISLRGVCHGHVPTWNRYNQILLMKSKAGIEPDFCGYAIPPNYRSDNYTCGIAGPEFQITSRRAIGDCTLTLEDCEQVPSPCCEYDDCCSCVYCGYDFYDLQFYVQTFKESWMDSPEGASSERYCKMLCGDWCYGHFKQCPQQCHYKLYPAGCLRLLPSCIDDRRQMKIGAEFFPEDCYGYSDYTTVDVCYHRTAVYTIFEVASSDFLWNLTECGTWSYPYNSERGNCRDCEFTFFEKCASIGYSPWGMAFSYYRAREEMWWPRRQITHYHTDTGDGHTCWKHTGYGYLGETTSYKWLGSGGSTATACTTYTDPDFPALCNGDCQDCEPCVCHDCSRCCCGLSVQECQDLCNPLVGEVIDGGPKQRVSGVSRISPSVDTRVLHEKFNENSSLLFPNDIEAIIEISVDCFSDITMPIKFSDSKEVHNSPRGMEAYELESERLRAPAIYSPQDNEFTQNINDRSATGSFATEGVPRVSSAYYLADFSKDGGEWSAWLYVSECMAQTLVEIESRVFTFKFIVFAYCNCYFKDKECVCKKQSFVLQEAKGVTFKI